MNQTSINTINQEIYRRFPEFKGVRPKVQAQSVPHTSSPGTPPTYLLTFHTRVNTAGNKTLPRWVRVVANDQGKILKITTSR